MNRPIVSFHVPGVPQPKGSWRPRKNRRTGKLFLSPDNDKSKPWQGLVSMAASKAWGSRGLMDGAVTLLVLFVLPRPKTVKIKKRQYPIVAPDTDKLLRCLKDALTGIVYRDDSQVVEPCCRKEYDDACKECGAYISLYPGHVTVVKVSAWDYLMELMDDGPIQPIPATEQVDAG